MSEGRSEWRPSIDDGVNAARLILPRCWFDRERCGRELEALRQYSKAWSEERKMFSERPAHDWSSHAADAFRYLAVGLREPRSEWNPRQPLVASEDEMPDCETLHHLRRMEQGGPPVYRDSRGNWRVIEVITEEE